MTHASIAFQSYNGQHDASIVQEMTIKYWKPIAFSGPQKTWQYKLHKKIIGLKKKFHGLYYVTHAPVAFQSYDGRRDASIVQEMTMSCWKATTVC